MYLHLRLFNTNHTQPPAQRPAPRHDATSGTPAAHNYCGMPIPQLPATASQNSLNIQPHRQHPHPRQPAATTPTTPTKQQCRHTSHTHFTIFPRNINRAAFSEAEVFQGGKKDKIFQERKTGKDTSFIKVNKVKATVYLTRKPGGASSENYLMSLLQKRCEGQR